MNHSITKDGQPLDESLYTVDEKTKIFSSNENDLLLDFDDAIGWTFSTQSGCTFFTGCYCIFFTGDGCTFKTSHGCTFSVGSNSTFNTGRNCTLLCWNNDRRYFLDGIYRYILHNKGLLKLKNKNDSLLNIRHDSEYVREVCNKLIKEKD